MATEKEETAITENQTENKMTTTKTKTQIAQTGDTKKHSVQIYKSVPEGFNVRGNSADKADSDLDEWLAGLNY